MAFINEYVPKAEWDLYNSFELTSKSINIGKKKVANEHSGWIVDRDRDSYFIMTGVISREEIEFYTLVLDGKKVDIIVCFERRFEKGMQKGYKVSSIIADKGLESRESEYLELIKEALLLGWESGLDFIEFVQPRYREVN